MDYLVGGGSNPSEKYEWTSIGMIIETQYEWENLELMATIHHQNHPFSMGFSIKIDGNHSPPKMDDLSMGLHDLKEIMMASLGVTKKWNHRPYPKRRGSFEKWYVSSPSFVLQPKFGFKGSMSTEFYRAI